MAKNLESVLKPGRALGLAAMLGAAATSACAATSMYIFRNYDIDGDGRMDMLDDSFQVDFRGRTVYNLRVRHGGECGTEHDPGCFLTEINASLVLPEYSEGTNAVSYFLNVNGNDVLAVVERRKDVFDVYFRRITPSANCPSPMRVEPPHMLGGFSPDKVCAGAPVYIVRNRAVERPRNGF